MPTLSSIKNVLQVCLVTSYHMAEKNARITTAVWFELLWLLTVL